MKEDIKVTIGQIGNDNFSDLEKLDPNNGLSYKQPKVMWEKIRKAIEVARQEKSDFLILPEITVPNSYISSHIPTICNAHNLTIIGGVEFYHKSTINGKRFIQNEAFIAVPGPKAELGMREKAMVWRVPKIYPATTEEAIIKKEGYHFLPGNKLYLFKSKEFGNWAVLICVDYLNLPIHQILQKKIQTLFIVAFNPDLNYYYSISDSLHRILYCNIVVCNISNFGGSHVYTPYREAYKREVMKLHGNKVETAVTIQLPLKILKEIQEAPQSKHFDGFIKKPSDYEYIT
ncbi:hypothetical protein CSV75_07635 [Sporosarcina sp. P18a]|uniref:hypothetical protein n=1 Tax=Sporosarcina sp. P18a TaxID=2048259 RepID=UPI000C1642E0|nr:hypothetical protein [Sporosarcina sp. P18a]PIC81630.1 hypothetical protein CSV75_07635 [Sporosarcina sp. P18a]